MDEKTWPKYIDICIWYRIFTLTLSTAVYIGMSVYYKNTNIYWGIIFGMFASCSLSSWLYRKIGQQVLWLRIMFSLEVFAYGIFTFLSGGFSSPYLWYQLSCIFLMIAFEKYFLVTILASLWCLLCALLGNIYSGLTYQELNVALGMLIVVVGFYILHSHIKFINHQKHLLFQLNLNLEKEKEKSEYAFLQLTNLYETFNLFAMTNPEKIIKELSILLKRSIAPSGCALLKFDVLGLIEKIENYNIQKDVLDKIIDELHLDKRLNKKNINIPYQLFNYSGDIYEIRIIGDTICSSGAFIRNKSDYGQENEDFYWKLIEIIFINLDTHSQMEKFITMDEQNRIANEIHDTVIQKLFGAVCSIKIIENSLDAMETPELRENLIRLKKSIELTMTELRESIYGRSFTKTINTFIGAMKLYMEEAESLSGSAINLDIDKEADYMSVAQKIAIYRISCEAVNNAIRHGNANNIDLSLKLDNEKIILTVEDNGSGFSKNTAKFSEGNGLRNMRNMANLLKGILLIEPKESGGIKVNLSLPR